MYVIAFIKRFSFQCNKMNYLISTRSLKTVVIQAASIDDALARFYGNNHGEEVVLIYKFHDR